MNLARNLALVALTALPATLLQAQTSQAPAGTMPVAAPGGCPQVHPVGPVLLYRLSGSTLLGEVHLQLVVMSDGLASLSTAQARSGAAGGVQLASGSTPQIQSLQQGLVSSGAISLCDDEAVLYDAPLATVTVFGANGSSNTFSYFPAGAAGSWSAVELVVQTFLGAEFDAGTGTGLGAPAFRGAAARPLASGAKRLARAIDGRERNGAQLPDRVLAATFELAAPVDPYGEIEPHPFLVDHRQRDFDRSSAKGLPRFGDLIRVRRLVDVPFDPTDPLVGGGLAPRIANASGRTRTR